MLQRSTQRNKQQDPNQQTQGPGYRLTEGSVTAVDTFPSAIHAEVDGEPVRILAAGNVLGMSPAYLVVDEQQDSQWVSLEDTKITDPNFLPITTRTKRSQKI